MRSSLLVFGLLCCLYLLTGGGQGYSVDGAFSYSLARALATEPGAALRGPDRDTLKRWGPVVPALGAPFAWLGGRLGDLAPRRDTVAVDGRVYRLYDWPAIGVDGPPEAGADAAGTRELALPVPPASGVTAVRVVSFLSFASDIADGSTVAEMVLEPGAAAAAELRAGRETAEGAHDLPLAARPAHARARLAGHWPGNPQANLYYAELPVAGPESVSLVTVRYLAPAGRLHLRSVALVVPGGVVEVAGPPAWSAEQQAALFTRFGFSFLNAPLMALTCALLVPLARLLGYSPGPAVVLAIGFGLTTLAWPYAKHDFSETAAATFAVAATVLVFAAAREPRTTRARLLLAGAAGTGAALAAGAKYTAAWFVPILAVQLLLLVDLTPWPPSRRGKGERLRGGVGLDALTPWPRRRARERAPGGPPRRGKGDRMREAAACVAAFLAPALAAGAGAVIVVGAAPTLWAGWREGLARGWLDFPAWAGLYGLLLSPGKSVFLYDPPLLLSVLGAAAFVRRHGRGGFVFVAVPLVYLAVFSTKGIWHGGGWGPRYLVPALPFATCLALPLLERAFGGAERAVPGLPHSQPGVSGGGIAPATSRLVNRNASLGTDRALRRLVLALGVAGLGVQALGVAKHPNLYTVMFRDHILPALPDYGAPFGGPPAMAYWRHFGGPGASRQLDRPNGATAGAGSDAPSGARRGLGYLFAEQGPLELRVQLLAERTFDATLYTCDWDRRGRRQRITLVDGQGERSHAQDYDFSGCEYLTWAVAAGPNAPLVVRVEATGRDVPVLSALFFDPPLAARDARPRHSPADRVPWFRRFGAEGHVLFAWQRGGQDAARLPAYVATYAGGDRVWIDTGEVDLADTALLYAPGFSPLLGHAWLLGADVVAALFPGNAQVQQRALASPPWRYVHGLEVHSPHPEYGLGLDWWPLLLRAHFRSHHGFMAGVWVAAGALAAGALACACGLALRPTLEHRSRRRGRRPDEGRTTKDESGAVFRPFAALRASCSSFVKRRDSVSGALADRRLARDRLSLLTAPQAPHAPPR